MEKYQSSSNQQDCQWAVNEQAANQEANPLNEVVVNKETILANETGVHNENSSTVHNETSSASQSRNYLLPGIVIGSILGAAMALRNPQTRKKVTDTAANLKENPKETMEDMTQRFKNASFSFKEAMSEANAIFTMVNDQLLKNKGSNSITGNLANTANLVNVASEAKEKLKEAAANLSEAGRALSSSPSQTTASGSRTSDTGQ
ncbi:hypothetical protein GCM10009865_07620 [Aeromicrobium ponti]|uniref:Uncharacterized protein n=1 Tax=Cytobacillus oceanisediminis TaxID=665099 RepID=A0A562K7L7_9BACI|nr:YtxH domain-containing protein [Cytobacillus oceanisediminis]TWH91205.1 hypothetical protein IQ19_00661 [Cytobacillus oceanisediminis]